jgi:hypothetical protein
MTEKVTWTTEGTGGEEVVQGTGDSAHCTGSAWSLAWGLEQSLALPLIWGQSTI